MYEPLRGEREINVLYSLFSYILPFNFTHTKKGEKNEWMQNLWSSTSRKTFFVLIYSIIYVHHMCSKTTKYKIYNREVWSAKIYNKHVQYQIWEILKKLKFICIKLDPLLKKILTRPAYISSLTHTQSFFSLTRSHTHTLPLNLSSTRIYKVELKVRTFFLLIYSIINVHYMCSKTSN